MDTVQVKFSEWIEAGFELFKKNMGVLILSHLILFLLGSVTFSILSGPLCAGVILITLALLDNKEPKPEVGDVFKGFELFLPAFLYVLVFGVGLGVVVSILNLIPCLGQVLAIAVCVAALPLLMFGMFLIADKKMDFWPAAMASYEKVKTNFWQFLGFAVVASLIGQVGLLACCIGVVVTAPISTCIVAVAYRDVFRSSDAPAPAEGGAGTV